MGDRDSDDPIQWFPPASLPVSGSLLLFFMFTACLSSITREENVGTKSTETRGQRGIERLRKLPLVDSSVLVGLLIQVLGYGTLLGHFPHSELSPIVELLQRVPAPLLIPFALFGIPAVLVSIGIGVPLTFVGLSLQSLPALLFARGDVVVFVSAYGLSVLSIWVCRRKKGELR